MKRPISFCSVSRAAMPAAPTRKFRLLSLRMPRGRRSPVWLSVIETLKLLSVALIETFEPEARG